MRGGMKRSKLGLALVPVIAYVAWPLWSGQQLKSAILEGDAATLERKVEWPSVRTSLKQSLNVYLSQQGVIAQALNAAFGTVVVDKIVENFVSPEGLIQLMASPEQRENLSPRHIRWAFFTSPTRFEMTMRPPKYPDTRMISSFDLGWRGWALDWRLASVRVVSAGK